MQWFMDNRKDLARHITYMEEDCYGEVQHEHRLLAIPSRERLERVLRYVLDENEFLAPYGVRALSRVHKDQPYVFHVGTERSASTTRPVSRIQDCSAATQIGAAQSGSR